MITQKEINRYIKDIKKELLYGSKQSREFLAQLRQNVCDFAAENENADMSQITEQFGKPEDIAATFFEQYGKEDIKKKVDIRRVVIAAVAIIVAVLVIAITIELIDSHKSGVGFFSEEVVTKANAVACINIIKEGFYLLKVRI